MSTAKIPDRHLKALMSLAGNKFSLTNTDDLVAAVRRKKPALAVGPPDNQLPKTLRELIDSDVRCFDLTVTAAINLNIPVVGSVGGGFSRRVVVLEQYAVKPIDFEGIRYDYGYAVRFCVTVSSWNANMKASLPFLAASVEIGSITAQWLVQVLGLSGPKITGALPPPTELNVEKFVIIKQKLEEIIKAIEDPTTVFTAALIHKVDPQELQTNRLKLAVGRVYALTMIEQNRSLGEALERLEATLPDDTIIVDATREIYKGFAGLDNDTAKPSSQARNRAREVLGRIKADV